VEMDAMSGIVNIDFYKQCDKIETLTASAESVDLRQEHQKAHEQGGEARAEDRHDRLLSNRRKRRCVSQSRRVRRRIRNGKHVRVCLSHDLGSRRSP
jgi:hypothetical protein